MVAILTTSAWLALLLAAPPVRASAPASPGADIVWYEDDRADIPLPRERDPNLLWDGVTETFFRPLGRATHPGRLVRRAGVLFGGDHVRPAANVNRLDEVPNSTWFTNRIGLFPLSSEDAARGPGDGTGPSREGPMTVIRAKIGGVTPGFTVRDARGVVYFVKFDPPGLPNIASAAGVISGRILHAAGYNVPDDGIITIEREDLVVGDQVHFTTAEGKKREMTSSDLDAILAAVDKTPQGKWRAIVSRLLPGKPLGPFDYHGRRHDDPNDRVNHEDRRELRGLRVFAAWIGHFDTKQHNSLDMYVEENGRHFVRHHLIDFASTLGTGAIDAAPRPNYEYTVDFRGIASRLGSAGLHEDAWRRVSRPAGLPEVGYLDSRVFDPMKWKPLESNAAFVNLTDRDGYWAAKIITAFTDEQLRAIVATGQYRDPDAAAFVARTLGERRDIVGRCWFDRLPPLDFFAVREGRVVWRDLGVERGLYPGKSARYRARVTDRSEKGEATAYGHWVDSDRPEFDSFPTEALNARLECQVNRGSGWSRSVHVEVDFAHRRITGIDRS